ncbi:MAG: VWA domain-containing protein [Bryobacterales bacterium]|nr:VWA domain-containing protein [Bryobacterales bacterium]
MLPFALLLWACAAQTTPEWRLVSEVRLVLLDVGVRGKDGNSVSGLRREQFQVFDNGKPTPLTSFLQEDLPVTLGIVTDASGSMIRKRAGVITSALLLVRESNPEDEVFLVSFNDTVRRGLPPEVAFTNQAKVLRAALLEQQMAGRTALRDGLHEALLHIGNGSKQRRALVLISDGADNASLTPEEEILKQVRAAHTTIYTIELFDERNPERDPGFLQRIAALSGGESYRQQPGARDLEAICRRIAHDIRSRYLLGFAPVATAKREVRRIRVEVRDSVRGKLTARTRRTYIAQPISEEVRR